MPESGNEGTETTPRRKENKDGKVRANNEVIPAEEFTESRNK